MGTFFQFGFIGGIFGERGFCGSAADSTHGIDFVGDSGRAADRQSGMTFGWSHRFSITNL